MQHTNVVSRTINVLNAMAAKGAKFYVELPDGSKYGNIKLVTPKPKRQVRPYGSVKDAIIPFLTGLDVGELVSIPIPSGFTRSGFQSAIATRAVKLWGNEAHTTCITATTVDVMRLK